MSDEKAGNPRPGPGEWTGPDERLSPVARAAFEVVATGPLALLHDSGRPGHAHLGVTASGAADRASAAAANRLVGNRPGAAVVEAVFGGLELRAGRALLVALTGASGTAVVTEQAGERGSAEAGAEAEAGRAGDGSPAETTLDPKPGGARIRRVVEHPAGTSFTVGAGDSLLLTPPASGLRYYLAVRGGFDAEPVLGSRSTDVLSGLGPAPLAAGDLLQLAGEHEGGVGARPAATSIPPPLPAAGTARLAVLPGPRRDWFGERGWRQLLDTGWVVGTDSNRVGLRLTVADDAGAGVQRAPGHEGELASEGMVAGAVQIPPSGRPVVFLRDHPVTGGYPVIAVLTEAAVDTAAQLRPGDAVRFREA